MLNIYREALEVCRSLAPVIKELERRDRDLARQLRRALTSVPLNLAEGSGSSGANRRQRYATALGSANEVQACLEVAVAMELLPAVDEEVADRLEKVARTANRLSRG